MKVLLVLLDGLRLDTALNCFGFMRGLCEAHKATVYSLRCELPSLSRPLYHCVLGGVAPVQSGIVHNNQARLAHEPSLFSLASVQGKVTAASAYSWISELYNRAPYHVLRDRFTDDASLSIQHGIFYSQDEYPDQAVFDDGEILRLRWNPDVLLLHTMAIDDAGHHYGANSPQYINAAIQADRLLALHLPMWLEDGYQVLVTSDHGLHENYHNGTTDDERNVPLFTLGDAFSHKPGLDILQTQICGTACQLLNLDHNKPFNPELLA